MQTIRLGISTCPNDTFAFHGLMEKRVDWRGVNFEIEFDLVAMETPILPSLKKG